MIAATDVTGIISYSLYSNTITSSVFFDYCINNLFYSLNRFPLPRSVLVLDNARVHKYFPFYELMRRMGVKIKFLPPYCPFLNVIEQLFNALKWKLKKLRYLCYVDIVSCIRILIRELQCLNLRGAMIRAGYARIL